MRTNLVATWSSRVLLAGFAAAAAIACGSEGELPIVQKDPPQEPPPPPTTTKEDAAPPAWCADAEGVYAAKPVPGNVLFVVDRSGSMQIKLSNGGTRWTESKKGFFSLLESLPANTRVGAMMFPQGDAPITCCNINPTLNDVKCNCATGELPGIAQRCAANNYNVPIPVTDISQSQIADIESYISSSDKEFYWGTPLAPSLQGAIAQQKALKATGTKSIVLLTDGYPTSCDSTSDPKANDIQRVVDVAAQGSKDGVRTFVMGVIDGTKGARADYLSPVAAAGGTSRSQSCATDSSCFYPVNEKTFAQDMKSAFDQIAMQAFDCTFDLPEVQGNATADLSKINVQLKDSKKNATPIARDTTQVDGWDFLPDQKHLQLHGGACAAVKGDTSTSVEIVVGCKTQGK